MWGIVVMMLGSFNLGMNGMQIAWIVTGCLFGIGLATFVVGQIMDVDDIRAAGAVNVILSLVAAVGCCLVQYGVYLGR